MFSSLTISTVIRISLMILFIVLVFGGGGLIRDFTVLSPSAVLEGGEVWRLLLYPFVPDPVSLLVAALVFGETAERIEDLLGLTKFGLLLLFLTLLPGLAHLLLFSHSDISLYGSLNLSLTLALVSYYVFRIGDVRILFFNLSRILFTGLVLALGLVMLIFSINAHEEPLLLLTSGPTAALIALLWFHLRYRVSGHFPRLTGRLAWLGGTEGEGELRRARFGDLSAREVTGGDPRSSRERQRPSPAQQTDAILEKISRRGVDSLTREERDFLEDYSRRL